MGTIQNGARHHAITDQQLLNLIRFLNGLHRHQPAKCCSRLVSKQKLRKHQEDCTTTTTVHVATFPFITLLTFSQQEEKNWAHCPATCPGTLLKQKRYPTRKRTTTNWTGLDACSAQCLIQLILVASTDYSHGALKQSTTPNLIEYLWFCGSFILP